jgi:phosphatidylglycerophosphatase A
MKRLLTSCFGLGWLPVAPGTFGSLPPVLLFVLMCRLGSTPTIIAIVMALLTLVGSLICIKFASTVIATTGESDPREVVADEFAGQAVTFSLIAAAPISDVWVTGFLGFLLFRIFDISKPWPIRRLEKLPEGWGILADDLLAGVFAAIVLLVCIRLRII